MWLALAACGGQLLLLSSTPQILSSTVCIPYPAISRPINPQDWQYVDSTRNPGDDITLGKGLTELAGPNRWFQGPEFLLLPPDLGTSDPQDVTKLKCSSICDMAVMIPSNTR